ncbi:MAG: DUF362 domain-containing protein [Treponema sp.]|jgi:uncharacterized protein (DUF362 family)|nr:DUF362 domain-containing protein [Treponema sp.]
MIVINYGKERAKITHDALKASDINTYLKPEHSVSLKPNLVSPKPSNMGSTTHSEVLEGIILFLKDFGIRNINIIENSSFGQSAKQAFKVCGYETLSKKYGVPLIDLGDDRFVTLKHSGYELKISEKALNTDFLINVPVLKAHSQTRLTCCMKNLKGCMPQSEMRRFHSLGLHKPIVALNALLKTGYCVVDGICGDLSFEEGGTPVEANRVIAGQNPLTVDSYCAELIGYKPDDIEYLSIGKKMMLGEYYSGKTNIVELNGDRKPLNQAKSERIADRYRGQITEDSACSVCYAALIFALHRSDFRGDKICIGQGFKGKSADCPGIGDCTRNFRLHAGGCPPKASDIISFLKSI